jgi:hypothetical protein
MPFRRLDMAFNNAGIQVPLSDAAVTSSVTATGRSSDDDADYQTAYQSARKVAVNGRRG